MMNIAQMSPKEKYDYIFSFSTPDHPNPITRFDWIERVLFGDIQTFMDGIHNYLSQKNKLPKDPPRGGGNLALPILICSVLELTSALYAGKTLQKDGSGYNATENVRQFVIKYFPGFYPQFPLIFWDGVRNGITHSSFPKFFEYAGEIIGLSFFVEDPKAQSNIRELDTKKLDIKEFIEKGGIKKSDKIILIAINSLELVRILKESIQRYRSDLQTSEDLQNKFIEGFSSFEEVIKIDKDKLKGEEAKKIIDKLTREKFIILELNI